MAFCLLVGLIGGCTAFNPAFVDLFNVEGQTPIGFLENAPGHVVIAFVNNATVDERLLQYLESAEGGNLQLTDAEKRDLRPRIRMRVMITFTDGSEQEVEFVDGSSKLVDQDFDAQAEPDLNQNDLNNVVATCDVQDVRIMDDSDIEVFMPVEIAAYQAIDVTNNAGEFLYFRWEVNNQIPPEFRVLQYDEVDDDGNVILEHNVGARDVPSPVTNVSCGSVVTFVVDGVLTSPFLPSVVDLPAYDVNDEIQEARIGGRFEFTVGVE